MSTASAPSNPNLPLQKTKARTNTPTPAPHSQQLQLSETSPSISSMSGGTMTSSNTVRIPKAVQNYSAETHDYDLRSQINIQLLDTGLVHTIQQTLLTNLQSHPSDWPAKIQHHALHLLRSGECTTFPSLMTRVLADIKADNKKARAMGEYKSSSLEYQDDKKYAGRKNGVNGIGGDIGLAIPGVVVEEGVRVTREALGDVCEIVGGEVSRVF